MTKEIIFEGPLNNLSMGNVSINLLKSLHKKGIKVHYLPIGQADVGNYNLTEDFKKWLQDSSNSFLKNFKRSIPTLKNWHIASSHTWASDKRFLLTYHECDTPTEEELNTIKNIDKTLFCGDYSENIFKDVGAKNVGHFHLGFDDSSFQKLDKKYFNDNRIQWFLGGKMEQRKKTLQVLSLWAKKFGKKEGESYKAGEQMQFLNCAILNPFYDANVQQNQITQVLGGQRYTNIQFFGFLNRESYNDLLNSSDIDLTGLSGAESWNLVSFNMSCLGKWSIVLNCTGHKTWANENNCILIQPSGKVSCVDNIHFHQNAPFNRGNFYSFSDEDVLKAMDLAITKAKTPNIEGEKLKEVFTYDLSVDNILKEMEN
jgi:hypothetical protein